MIKDERQRLRKSWGNPKMVFISVGRLVALKGFSLLLKVGQSFPVHMMGQVNLLLSVPVGTCRTS
jgi:glycogen synthase